MPASTFHHPRPLPAAGTPLTSAARSLAVGLVLLAAPWTSPAMPATTCQLAAAAPVDGSGFYLRELAPTSPGLPDLRLGDAPLFGQTNTLTRADLMSLLAATACPVAITNWTGAAAVEIYRRSHDLGQMEMLQLLTGVLQRDYVRDKGELELDATEPWEAPTVPDEPLTVKFLELPASGVAPACILRFELCTATEVIGTWQISVRAHVWRQVWAAHSNLERGEPANLADLDQERRDVLGLHETLARISPDDASLELATSVEAGNILLARDLKPRAVIHRGQMADALLRDGVLNILMKVEVLEDGAPGQIIEVRNPVSLRNLSGKVVDDQTIAISL